MGNWQPSATLETLRARAALLARIRAFFAQRGVLEVDTPVLSRHATVDRHIESWRTAGNPSLWLHTSPEFAMKRLLAAGSGPIFQVCHVFRSEPPAPMHNPEFLMLEWYRPGWGAAQLMDEVEALVRACLSAEQAGAEPFQRLSYRAAFLRRGGLDPFDAPLEELRDSLAKFGVAAPESVAPADAHDRDFWLHLWMGAVVGPRLGTDHPCFVHDFPASQAALARVREDRPPVAERFELVWKGTELANGFHELTDAAEQRRRFEDDRAWRRARGRPVPPHDEPLLAALEAGVPEGSGVALGIDRLLMLMLGLGTVAQSMPFDATRA